MHDSLCETLQPVDPHNQPVFLILPLVVLIPPMRKLATGSVRAVFRYHRKTRIAVPLNIKMALRLMDFVSENQVEKEKELFEGGPRVVQRAGANEKPLYEILKDNKDKKDAEFTEKFKHRPPKALDEDETEFLEAVEMHKRELESKQKEEEALQLLNFQAALASRTVATDEPRVFVSQPKEVQELPRKNKQPASGRTLPISVKFKLVPKKIKLEPAVDDQESKNKVDQAQESLVADRTEVQNSTGELPHSGLLGLSSYSDDSDDDDE